MQKVADLVHGWIILDKPLGMGSTQAVSAVKRALREAGEPKTKVGHGGTLDPLASGVLPIAIGEATKLAGRMLDATKAYDFTIRFGEQTDTLDAEGQVVVDQRRPPHGGAGGGDPAPLHRRDRAGSARLFGAKGRGQGRLRPGAGRRAGRAQAAAGDGARPQSSSPATSLPSPAPSPKAPTSAASPATSRWRSARSAMWRCCAAPGPGRSASKWLFRWTF